MSLGESQPGVPRLVFRTEESIHYHDQGVDKLDLRADTPTFDHRHSSRGAHQESARHKESDRKAANRSNSRPKAEPKPKHFSGEEGSRYDSNDKRMRPSSSLKQDRFPHSQMPKMNFSLKSINKSFSAKYPLLI